jgi:uncharacterized protein YjlB
MESDARQCVSEVSLVSIRKSWMDTAWFSCWKRTIFPKVKESKPLHGGVAVYAAHARVQTNAEVGEKGRFLMETSLGVAVGDVCRTLLDGGTRK